MANDQIGATQGIFGSGSNLLVTGGSFTINQPSWPMEPGLSYLSQAIAHSATYDSAERYPHKKCDPGTYGETLEEIIEWINDPNPSTNVLWLYGPAGTCKTAILQTIAELLSQTYKERYAGSFFFLKGDDQRGLAKLLFSTLAYQIAVNVPSMRSLIDKAMAMDTTLPSKSLSSQLRSLIVEPSLRLPSPLTHTPTIIIDGLDECQTPEIQVYVLSLIGDLLKHGNLPFKFLIASRPDSQIRDSFAKAPLSEITKHVDLIHSPRIGCVERAQAVPLLRACHNARARHFYTTDAAEMQRATSQLGYFQEMSPGLVFPRGHEGLVPLYRVYNPQLDDHCYTADFEERDNAIQLLGYLDEGVVGYVYSREVCGAVPLFREYSERSSDHFYTTDVAERDNASNNLGYSQEGIAGYILPFIHSPCIGCVGRDLAVPLLRAWRPSYSDHFYTTDAAEMQRATSQLGYCQETSPGLVFPRVHEGLVPLYRLYSPRLDDHFYTASFEERDNAIQRLGYSDEGVVGHIYSREVCGAVPLFREYSERSSDHFYTTDVAERDNASNYIGYSQEGIAGYILPLI